VSFIEVPVPFVTAWDSVVLSGAEYLNLQYGVLLAEVKLVVKKKGKKK
jgi:hypothetical protein